MNYLEAKLIGYARKIVMTSEDRDTIAKMRERVDEEYNFSIRNKEEIKLYIPTIVLNNTSIQLEKIMFDTVNNDVYGHGENVVIYLDTKKAEKVIKSCFDKFSKNELSSAFDRLDTRLKKIVMKKVDKLSTCDGRKRTKMVSCINSLIGVWRKNTENGLISLGKFQGYDTNLVQNYASGKVDMKKYVNDNFSLDNRKLKKKYDVNSKTK